MGGYGVAVVNEVTTTVAGTASWGFLVHAWLKQRSADAAKEEAEKAKLAKAELSWRERVMLYITTKW